MLEAANSLNGDRKGVDENRKKKSQGYYAYRIAYCKCAVIQLQRVEIWTIRQNTKAYPFRDFHLTSTAYLWA